MFIVHLYLFINMCNKSTLPIVTEKPTARDMNVIHLHNWTSGHCPALNANL